MLIVLGLLIINNCFKLSFIVKWNQDLPSCYTLVYHHQYGPIVLSSKVFHSRTSKKIFFTGATPKIERQYEHKFSQTQTKEKSMFKVALHILKVTT